MSPLCGVMLAEMKNLRGEDQPKTYNCRCPILPLGCLEEGSIEQRSGCEIGECNGGKPRAPLGPLIAEADHPRRRKQASAPSIQSCAFWLCMIELTTVICISGAFRIQYLQLIISKLDINEVKYCLIVS